MGEVIIQSLTTINPLSVMGEEAGICWGANTNHELKNFKRGLDCLESGHMRTAEYPQIYMVLDGYSARVIREFYTHIGGGPTRLQASTRYINYSDFEFIDVSFKDSKSQEIYEQTMAAIAKSCQCLEELGEKREDIANLLPLGMKTKVVVRTNLRNLIDMAHQRLCTRAYWEFRRLMQDILEALSAYSDEWEILIKEKKIFKPKCEVCGFCTEKFSCGRRPTKEQNDKYLELGQQLKNKNFIELIKNIDFDKEELEELKRFFIEI